MKALIKSIKKILEDNKAERISIIDVTNKSSVTDTMFIVSGRSSRHVQAIADYLVDKLKEKKIKPPPPPVILYLVSPLLRGPIWEVKSTIRNP